MDQYAPYVISAYAATVLILGGIIVQSILSARRARRDLDQIDREREK